MKIRLLIIALAICVIATPAMAGMYTLDATIARQFTQLNTVSLGNDLFLVIDSPGTAGSTAYIDDGLSGSPPHYGVDQSGNDLLMQYEVGFVGLLMPGNIMSIGIANPSTLGTYDSFGMALANDNDDPWDVRVFTSTDTDPLDGFTVTAGAWTRIYGLDPPYGPMTTFLSMGADFSTLTYFGFQVQGVSTLDVFHISAVVPTPAAVILGILGLGAVGIKLRKYA